MPLLGTRGAASARGFGMFGGAAPLPNWIGTLGGASNETGYGVAVDAQSNVYFAGAFPFAYQGIAKYNSAGVIQWQKQLNATQSGLAVAVDSSSNVYVVGQDFLIAKYNSSGALQWQRLLGTGTKVAYGVAIDSSNNVYVAGYGDDGLGSYEIRIAQYNSSGTLQWQRKLGGSGVTDERAFGVAVDSSGNVYVNGYSIVSGIIKLQLAKYNSSGTIQWQREVNSGTDQFNGYGVAVDSSANVYAVGDLYISGVGGLGLVKYDTSGTLQWARRLTGSGQNSGQGVTVDSSNNIYICGYSGNSGTNDPVWAKYDSSGTLQWQRRLTSSITNEQFTGAKADSASGLLLNGYSTITGGSTDLLFARMPQDGSKTGTYTVNGQSFSYAASGLSASSPSLTSTTSTLTDAATSYTSTTTSYTSSTTTLTSSVTTL